MKTLFKVSTILIVIIFIVLSWQANQHELGGIVFLPALLMLSILGVISLGMWQHVVNMPETRKTKNGEKTKLVISTIAVILIITGAMWGVIRFTIRWFDLGDSSTVQ
jgi:hypothetical protein